jgi:hypothetical protein
MSISFKRKSQNSSQRASVGNRRRPPNDKLLLHVCKGFATICYMAVKEKQINFRPSEDGLTLIDGLAQHFGISRSAVIELAVRRLAQHEQMLQSVFPGDTSNLALRLPQVLQHRKIARKDKKK